MRLPMVDCRSLIEFCKAFEQHNRNMHNSHARLSSGFSNKQTNPLTRPFCHQHSPLAAVDLVLLVLVLGSLGFLTIPYFKFVIHQASEFLPIIYDLLDLIINAPIPYVVGLIVAFALVILTIFIWEFIDIQSRKCGNPYCKALRKSVEFDIQLESEECVKKKHLHSALKSSAYGIKPLELGEDHKELEAELKRMAPFNGRTVLIFRAPCGCPVGRLEVWGPRKIRRIKKSVCSWMYWFPESFGANGNDSVSSYPSSSALHFDCLGSFYTSISQHRGLIECYPGCNGLWRPVQRAGGWPAFASIMHGVFLPCVSLLSRKLQVMFLGHEIPSHVLPFLSSKQT